MNHSNSVRKKSKSSHLEENKPQQQQSLEEHQLPTTKKRRRSRRPSKTYPLISIGTILQNKYELRDVIGAGGYGQIYKAYNPNKNMFVAVKVMVRSHEPQRMILEQNILFKLKGKPNFPQLYGSGNLDVFMYIIMELLGRSLSDLRKKSENRRFDPPTAIRVGIQALESLKTLHEMGFVHRDMKPANLCIGADASTVRQIYIVDFGLARQFKENGKVKKRGRAGFRGTMRYVSLNVHEKKDQNPCDDLIALYYSIVEMSEGGLPWTRMRDSDDIARKKKTISFTDMCSHQSNDLFEFYSHCYETCEDPNQPNYELLFELLRKCLPPNFNEKTPYSYETIIEAQTVNASQDHTNAENDNQNGTF